MTQIKKVAIIAGQLVVGGAERQLYFWLSHLDRRLFQPIVITLHPGHNDYWEKPIEDLGILLYKIPSRKNKLFRLLDIAKILNVYRPHLIHAWHLFASPYAGLLAKPLGAKSLGSLRDSFRRFYKNPLSGLLTLSFVNAILVNSYAASEKLRLIKFRINQKVYTVQNAVEENPIQRNFLSEDLKKFKDINRDITWILSVGRLDPKKRFDLLLRIIALLRQESNDFHFVLMGDGQERENLEKLAEDLKITDCITFAGEVQDATRWMGAFDIFCFTSLDEGLPNVVMEAAVASIPIVSWRVPFMEELLKGGEEAYLVEKYDFLGFKNALIKLMHSPSLRNQIGHAAHQHILEEFSIDRYVERMTTVYQELTSRTK